MFPVVFVFFALDASAPKQIPCVCKHTWQ